jgi:hypothetical protein
VILADGDSAKRKVQFVFPSIADTHDHIRQGETTWKSWLVAGYADANAVPAAAPVSDAPLPSPRNPLEVADPAKYGSCKVWGVP